MELIYLDSWAFATVFLRVKHAGAAVLKMLLSTPDISFNVDLAVMTPVPKNIYYLVDNRYLTTTAQISHT